MRKILFILASFILLLDSTLSQKIIYFDEVGEFNEGLAPVRKDKLWGFIDTEGNVVIQPQFAERMLYTPKFSSGICRVYDIETGSAGFIDKSGKFVIPYKYYAVSDFNGDFAVNYEPGSASDPNTIARCRIINKNGDVLVEVSPNDYSYETEFFDERARFRRGMERKNGFEILYGFMDSLGQVVIEDKYTDIRDFSEGLAAVMLEDKWGFIDMNGNTKVDFQFTYEPKFFSGGRCIVQSKDFNFSYIDKQGQIIIEPKYKQAFPYEMVLQL
jgi:hypothetical protein